MLVKSGLEPRTREPLLQFADKCVVKWGEACREIGADWILSGPISPTGHYKLVVGNFGLLSNPTPEVVAMGLSLTSLKHQAQ